jgi:hypothetical protein
MALTLCIRLKKLSKEAYIEPVNGISIVFEWHKNII